MSVVTYKCNTCNRSIDIPQNKHGLEVIHRCVITDGCRGEMQYVTLRKNHVRRSTPPPIANLADWTQRQVLYNHDQPVKSVAWTVNHNLGVQPLIQVFVERPTSTSPALTTSTTPCEARVVDDTTTLVEQSRPIIEVVSANTFIVHFTKPEGGMVHCIARSSKPVSEQQTAPRVNVQRMTITNGAELTIATPDLPGLQDDVEIVIVFVDQAGGIHEKTYIVDNTPSILSAWVDVPTLFINNRRYLTRSFNVADGEVEFATGAIGEGSYLYIKQFGQVGGSAPIVDGDVLVLLSTPPHSVFDKIVDRVIPATNIVEVVDGIVYSQLEFEADLSRAVSVYPHIRPI